MGIVLSTTQHQTTDKIGLRIASHLNGQVNYLTLNYGILWELHYALPHNLLIMEPKSFSK